MASIGENIKRLRLQNGWSQKQLAEKIGKSRVAICQYESGKNMPRMGTLEDLAAVFGVQKSEIVEESRPDYLSDDEHELVDLYRSIAIHDKQAVLNALRAYTETATQ